LKNIILTAKVSNNNKRLSQGVKENYITEIEKEILGFLNGDIDVSMNLCCNVRQGLGWSSKFVKCGLPLFLLLLLKYEDLGIGCKMGFKTSILEGG
jgi:hypothetical protein